MVLFAKTNKNIIERNKKMIQFEKEKNKELLEKITTVKDNHKEIFKGKVDNYEY